MKKKIDVKRKIAKLYLTLCGTVAASAILAADIVFYPQTDIITAFLAGLFMLLWSAEQF